MAEQKKEQSELRNDLTEIFTRIKFRALNKKEVFNIGSSHQYGYHVFVHSPDMVLIHDEQFINLISYRLEMLGYTK